MEGSFHRDRKQSLQVLLSDLYDHWHPARHYSFETESWTDNSFSTDALGCHRTHTLSSESLKNLQVWELQSLTADLEQQSTEISQRLVRELKRRDHQLSRAQAKCNIVTAVLQAMSPKRSVDAKLKFSLEPPSSESGFQQWLNAMRAVARLQDGIPHHFRRKLWLTLAQHHLTTSRLDWDEICRTAFSDRINPDDDKLGLQIIKDLHRTGWSGLSGEHERVMLKRVLLAYARYNKTIGYCQGFNVIAALVLEVTEYKEENALKVMIFLIEHVLPVGYFDQTLRALSVDMAVLRDLLRQRLPRLASHLDTLQRTSESEYEPPLTNVFTMQWFLTLFATCLPKNAVFRVWDGLMLEGSEMLLRTALAIWAKLGRRVGKASSADDFYGLMGPLCQELLRTTPAGANDLMQVIYSMAEFPYPGLADLREKYTWNIQPFSATFRLLRQQVSSILQSDDDSSDERNNHCLGFLPSDRICGSSRPSSHAPPDLSALQNQYKLMKQRQKQAAVILQNAYEMGQKRIALTPMKGFPTSPSGQVFNHLYVGKIPANKTYGTMNGTIPVASRVVQPGAKVRDGLHSRRSRESETLSTISPAISSPRRDSRETLLSSGNTTPASSPPATTQWRLSKAKHFPSLPDIINSVDMSDNASVSILRRSNSCIELQAPTESYLPSHLGYFPVKGFIHESISGCQEPAFFPAVMRNVTSPPPSANKKPSHRKNTNLLSKSKALLNSLKGSEEPTQAVYNPFPTRHQTKLIDREKKMGLVP